MNRSVLYILLLFLTLGMVSAQDKEPVFKSVEKLRSNSEQTSNFNQLQLARQLMRQRAYIAAADLLESLYSQNKTNLEIVNNLLRCYQELKAYDKAELLLTKRLEDDPFQFGNHSRLIGFYLQEGKDTLAFKQIQNTFEAFPGNPDIYIVLIKELVNKNFYDLADRFIVDGRRQFENDDLFSMDAARIYETRREYRPAVKEYFKALRADSTTVKLAERRMSMLIRYPDAPEEIILAMQEILDSIPNNEYALKYLQEAYIKNDQFENAFDVCLRLDSITSDNGNMVYRYMRLCRERKQYGQVIKTAEYLREHKADSKTFGDYKFYYAEALTGVGRFAEAISIYDDISQSSPRRIDQAEAVLKIGQIYRYQIKDYELARIYFDSAVTMQSRGLVSDNALNEIGLIHMVNGNLDSAETVYTSLKNRTGKNNQKEAIEYKLAMIKFYRKDYEAANLAFRKLMSEYAQGFFVNDALINSLIISEAQFSYKQALDNYCDAIYFGERQMPDSMAQKYREIISDQYSTLTGLSVYKLSEYLVQMGDTTAAIGLVDEMEKKYAEDYFFPYGLKLKADLLLEQGDKEMAAGIYRSLLKSYNRYPFTGEVRKTMQILNSETPAS